MTELELLRHFLDRMVALYHMGKVTDPEVISLLTTITEKIIYVGEKNSEDV